MYHSNFPTNIHGFQFGFNASQWSAYNVPISYNYGQFKLLNHDNENDSNNENNDPDFNKNKDIVKFILSNDPDSISNSSDSDNNQNPECCNPLCDHKDWSNQDIINEKHLELHATIDINNIKDLIDLGKTYHCRKNKIYYNIDLEILCRLVPPLLELNNMVGINNIKRQIVDHIIFFLQKLNEKDRCGSCLNCNFGNKCTNKLNNDMLHTVITGPPGVGKTEVGKILGKIYKAMGILSKGHMHIASRSDLVGKYLGHTAAKTQEFINKCKGGVMFIDEAYSLGNAEGRDSFSKECIDTINQNLTERRDFLCIIAGYQDALEKCFFNYNDGLRRRFPFRYNISGYSTDELAEIFLMKVAKDGWSSEFDNEFERTNIIPSILSQFFAYKKGDFPNYGGDVETLFLNCKICHSKRMLFKDPSMRKLITLHDLERGYELFIANRKRYNGNGDLTVYS